MHSEYIILVNIARRGGGRAAACAGARILAFAQFIHAKYGCGYSKADGCSVREHSGW
jgi:hypothetical protein